MAETVFVRFAMSFNGFFSLFCQDFGGLWWAPVMVLTEKKYIYIYEKYSDRTSNKVFLCLYKLDCKCFLNAFGLKKWPMLSKTMTMKKERAFEVVVGTQDEFWIQAVDLL